MSSRRSSCDESVGQGRLHPDVSLLDQVAQEDPDDTDRHVHVRGHLGDRAFVTQFENAEQVGVGGLGPTDLPAKRGLDRQFDLGSGTAAGQRVGPDDARDRRVVVRCPRLGRQCHDWSWSSVRGR